MVPVHAFNLSGLIQRYCRHAVSEHRRGFLCKPFLAFPEIFVVDFWDLNFVGSVKRGLIPVIQAGDLAIPRSFVT